ncbi:carbamate kinase [Mammaliicoccus sciuri]|uniref:carbamate kinase n=1 Tax=Mammaliicoccus TaxID=2803850 RepID=UPI000D1E777A|nr:MULTISPECIES: carbamate kinase [Mammaliicoccus]MCD8809140.1 carbamate kinase [Mammaliicoccus sciuri]MCJ0952476.1 carbamate kinase [Mammaliicoccus sciuri]MCJ1778201.1 carbamate kinase [Mammaliicoccus sciuri]MEB6226871.1 carbamate kinase [Mammaliicoccus sciuri]MEB7066424.1 carbamate kinase [Mammaliicoccus sciuri]
MGKRVVLALGGNAILQPNQEASYDNQYNNVMSATRKMAELKKQGHNIVITHGNGPQVGNIIAQNEAAKDIVNPLPINACSAESQGFIGYMMEEAIKNHLNDLGISSDVLTLLTMVEVDKDDQAFNNPTKPIGVFFSEEEAKRLEKEHGFVMVEDAGRGYRRVVPSPEPLVIHGVNQIKKLINQAIVISSGGGGIPVYRDEHGDIKGVEAVIDKDRSGLKLAQQVEADTFMMLTDVPNVCVNFGKENEEKLQTISVEEAKQYVAEDQFPAGSMLPKIEAAIQFAESGKEAIICSLDDAIDALEGKAGTRILLDPSAKPVSC